MKYKKGTKEGELFSKPREVIIVILLLREEDLTIVITFLKKLFTEISL